MTLKCLERSQMNKMRVYCVHPISGMSGDEVFEYYQDTYDVLSEKYDVLTPMIGKTKLRTEIKFKAEGYKDNPLATNHAIFERDRWMVKQSDIIYANLSGTDRVSIGSMMELAWASLLGKYIVLVMEKDNIHRHAFVLEAADVIFYNEEEALDYLRALANKEMAEPAGV
jgi:nucleoside 2-deoxyribosyltransferase